MPISTTVYRITSLCYFCVCIFLLCNASFFFDYFLASQTHECPRVLTKIASSSADCLCVFKSFPSLHDVFHPWHCRRETAPIQLSEPPRYQCVHFCSFPSFPPLPSLSSQYALPLHTVTSSYLSCLRCLLSPSWWVVGCLSAVVCCDEISLKSLIFHLHSSHWEWVCFAITRCQGLSKPVVLKNEVHGGAKKKLWPDDKNFAVFSFLCKKLIRRYKNSVHSFPSSLLWPVINYYY